ncbi:MAG: flavodoxin domain-containing protein [Alphaproteobacteria bacterium]|nr:flavodoxin domain-containing protein [Alphaproteobacteria bacterium]
MLNPEQQKLLQELEARLNRDQLLWVSGYLQGKAGGEMAAGMGAAPAADKPKVNIYYATETGNSKGLSLQVMKGLKGAGFKAKNNAVNRLKVEDIPKDEFAVFLISTHGEGDPPETAIKFFDAIKAADDNALEGLQFAMLGLGDKTYEIFCGAATQLQEQLERLGGKAFQEIALFDVDYASHTPKWIDETVAELNKIVGDTAPAAAAPMGFDMTPTVEVRTGKGYTRLEPVKGVVRDIVNLNDHDSKKQTYHIEIEYEDDIIYSCGDAAGIILPRGDEVEERELTPRLYSIASSPSYHEGEIHLTVALATYTEEDGSIGYGIASKYLAELKEGDEIEFYISQNQIFNLPANDQDAIMIGPGTGIAPFRSFVYERSELGHDGRNWVIFGDQHAHCDFLYQTEWQEHLATETIHKLDLAFSRDQDEKVYVQHRLQQNAEELMAWVDGGAAIYVCGNKDPMSKDVDKALIDIFTHQKSLSPEDAEDFLADLEEQGRYVKDVY